MEKGDFLRAANEFGVKSLPLVGDYLAEVIKDSYAGLTEAVVQQKLNLLRGRMNAQHVTLSYLVSQLASDDDLAEAKLVDPLNQLRYALDHPDEPDLSVKLVIDRFAQRFDDAAQFKAWASVEVRKLGDRVNDIERRVDILTRDHAD